ncbi:hypothetical protein KAS50_06220, partial [bacterium]|nr:hypothetical protein [bacterium]
MQRYIVNKIKRTTLILIVILTLLGLADFSTIDAAEVKITAGDAVADDYFGYSVSISGDYVIVGARFDDDAGISSGSAYIFYRNQGGADNWGQQAKLTAGDAAGGDEFGISVSISGDYAIVGARYDDDAGSNSGSAYIFFYDAPPSVANAISDVTVDEDADNTTIDLTNVFSDPDNDDALITKAVQSNTNGALVSASIVGNTLTLDYQDNQNGTAAITIRATSNGKTVDDDFTVTVNAVNDVPTISDISDQSTDENTPTAAIPFTIGDVETAAASLNLAGSSSDQAVVKDVNIVFGGAGSNRTVTITPENIQYGTTTITITVSDGVNNISDTFVLTVGTFLTLNSVNNVTAKERETIEFTLTSGYNGSSSLSYSMTSDIPSTEDATLNSSTGEFSWATDLQSAGFYNITFTVTDGTLSDSKSMTITVQDYDIAIEGAFIPDTLSIIRTTGGTVQVKAGGIYTKHKVYVPPGALIGNRTVMIITPTTDDIPEEEINNAPSSANFVVQEYEEGYTFEDSVTITVEYKDSEIQSNENNMCIHIWDRDGQIWKRVMGYQYINTGENTITAKVKHFSIYCAKEVGTLLQSSSSFEEGWIMISLPIEPDSPNDPESTFGDDVRPFQTYYRNSNIYYYNEVSGEWTVPTIIQNGMGYILYCYGNNTVDASGLEVTGDITKTLTYTNSNGWHLLGNPYAVEIDWDSDISRDSGIDDIYYVWTGSYYDNYPYGGLTRDIDAWQGFWVHTTTDSAEMTISYPGVSKRARQERIRPLLDWRIKIIAESGGNKDIHNYIGTSIDADIEYDAADVYELNPLSQEFISLYFPHTEWEENP